MGFQQHDSSEFAKVLLDILETQTKRPIPDTDQTTNLTARHFEGEMHSTVECGTCGTKSERKENYVDLQAHFEERNPTPAVKKGDGKEGDVEMKKEYDLQTMVQDGLSDEVLEGENLFFCKECDKQVPRAQKSYRLSKIPDTLLVTICRFYYDRGTKQKEKICTPV